MVDTKTCRFGRKATSLLLSGAMVVAFAPAVGAAVSEDVTAAYATEIATGTDMQNCTATTAYYNNTGSYSVKDGYLTLTHSQIKKALQDRHNGTPDAILKIASVTNRYKAESESLPESWEHLLWEETYQTYSTASVSDVDVELQSFQVTGYNFVSATTEMAKAENTAEYTYTKADTETDLPTYQEGQTGTKTTYYYTYDANAKCMTLHQGTPTDYTSVYVGTFVGVDTQTIKDTAWTGTSLFQDGTKMYVTIKDATYSVSSAEEEKALVVKASDGTYTDAKSFGDIFQRAQDESGNYNPQDTVKYLLVFSNGTAKVGTWNHSEHDASTDDPIAYELKDNVYVTEGQQTRLVLTAHKAGSLTMDSTITNDDQISCYVKAGDLYQSVYTEFSYDGKTYYNGDTIQVEYDGTDVAAKIDEAVWADKKALTEGTDYKTYVETDEGIYTGTAIEAGEYVKRVYAVDGTELANINIVILATPLTAVCEKSYKVADSTDNGGGSELYDVDGYYTTFLEYTGSELDVTPTFYKTTDGAPAYNEGQELKTGVLCQTNGEAATLNIPAEAYKREIKFMGATDTKKKTVTEIVDPGVYWITVTQDKTWSKYYDIEIPKQTYVVVVENAEVTYMELDKSAATLNEDGVVVFDKAFTPTPALFDENTAVGGVELNVPESAYTVTLKKATTFTNDKPSGYQTVESGKVEGAGYYQLCVSDASKTDAYDVDTMYYDFQVVAEEEEPAVEKANQNIKFSTKKRQSVAKGGSMQIKVKGVKTSVTFSKLRGSDYLTVSKSGTLKVNKLAKKGKTYRIKVKAKAKASSKYKADSEYKWFYVTVK